MRLWDSIKMEAGYFYSCEGFSRPAAYFMGAKSIIVFLFMELAVCKLFGHEMTDESSAGPDSGNMDCACKRCGRYWHIPLY